MKDVYQLGCQCALTKLGFIIPGAVGALSGGKDRRLAGGAAGLVGGVGGGFAGDYLGGLVGRAFGSKGQIPGRIIGGLLGQLGGGYGGGALVRKTAGARVLVTSDQTPQEQSEPSGDAALQQRTVEHLWDEHDKRQQLFTARNPD